MGSVSREGPAVPGRARAPGKGPRRGRGDAGVLGVWGWGFAGRRGAGIFTLLVPVTLLLGGRVPPHRPRGWWHRGGMCPMVERPGGVGGNIFCVPFCNAGEHQCLFLALARSVYRSPGSFSSLVRVQTPWPGLQELQTGGGVMRRRKMSFSPPPGKIYYSSSNVTPPEGKAFL